MNDLFPSEKNDIDEAMLICCQHCGIEISTPRLVLLPMATTCLGCQERSEFDLLHGTSFTPLESLASESHGEERTQHPSTQVYLGY
ncbi:MAG: TraR/DksA C4-type zinc finger protein [Akkermansiaceae bacterium]|jgi:hypothetical protein